jgi:hypothetical protein
MFATNASINQQVTLFCQITQLVVFKPLSVKYQQSLEPRILSILLTAGPCWRAFLLGCRLQPSLQLAAGGVAALVVTYLHPSSSSSMDKNLCSSV